MAIQIQVRRGTASQWTTANPTLAAGEIGFESDTSKIKIGDGSTVWTSLSYATLTPSQVDSAVSSAIANVIGSAPEALDTLNELAAAINDDPGFFSNITGVITTHANLTTSVHGITNTANLVYVSDLTAHANDTTNIHGIADTSALETTIGAQSKATAAQVAAASYTDTVASGLEAEIAQVDFKTVTNLNSIGELDNRIDNVVTSITSTDANVVSLTSLIGSTEDSLNATIVANKELLDANVTTVSNTINDHVNATTSVHGIANTAALETITGAQGKADAAEAAAIAHANTTVETHANVATSVHGISNTANLVYVSDLSSHASDGTDVHGISNTANLVYVSDLTAHSDDTTSIHGISNTANLVYASDLTSHAEDTTSIHGIADTSLLLTTAGGTLTGALTLHADPSQSMHAVTKQYVDNISVGLHVHEAAHAATTDTLANLVSSTVTYDNGTDGVGATLTLGANLTEVDGHTLTNGDRILVKNQATAAHNGIYTRTSATVLTRATDFDSAAEIAGGDFVFVENGTLYNSTGWVIEDEVVTVGTDSVLWIQFSGAGTYTANTTSGLDLVGNQFTVNASVVATSASLNTHANVTTDVHGISNTANLVYVANLTAHASVTTDVHGISNTANLVYTANLTSHASTATGVHGVTGNVVGTSDTQTLTNKTLTSPTVTTPTLTLSTSTSTTSGVLAYDSTNKKLVIGDGSVARPVATSLVITNAQGAGYTLVLADADKLVEMSGGGTLTVPANSSVAYPVGTQIDLLQTGASQVTVAGAGGVTVNGTPGLKLRTQWSSARLVKRATDTWVLLGDLAA